jgi:hypothetical protein
MDDEYHITLRGGELENNLVDGRRNKYLKCRDNFQKKKILLLLLGIYNGMKHLTCFLYRRD